MYSVCRVTALLCCAASLACAGGSSLRVCADPGNLPFSNARGQGFENALARMAARDLGRGLIYVWKQDRGGYLAKTLNSGLCDVVMGVPAGIAQGLPTQPYYRSSYSFVSRRGRRLHVHSLDDPALRHLRIGLHVLQHEDATAPPARALLRRGMLSNIVWYRLFPDFDRANPPAELIEAVERGDIDLAIAWGPLAGYFARRSEVPLDVTPISPDTAGTAEPLAFSISMCVRPGDSRLVAALNRFIDRRRPEIGRLLEGYGIPVSDMERIAKR
ncbi:MAG TPA: quinoprotein dehydrogenase-associated putative ABC transporter substrate-binding protein [Bryobacteraceae bacterium]|nr:quinoprotein dehydrogenase-associated putative ABC transporter substrate-binding protein [Bryobacteraceae bacterium]